MDYRQLLKKSYKTITVYYHRTQTRKELAKLDDRLLKDIGLSRSEQRMESKKPFWKK